MTVNRTICACALSIVFLSGGTSARAAQPASTLEQALQERISMGMTMPRVLGGQEMLGGIARVVFTVGNDGRTHDVKVARRSGSGIVDRAAVSLISSFRNLPPSLDGKPVTAVLQYGTSGNESDAAARKALATQVASARIDAANASRLARAQQAPDASPAAVALNLPVSSSH